MELSPNTKQDLKPENRDSKRFESPLWGASLAVQVLAWVSGHQMKKDPRKIGSSQDQV